MIGSATSKACLRMLCLFVDAFMLLPAAMHKATATPMEAKGDDEATESAAGQQAWPAAVMQSVLFAAGHDSAKSLRRAVLRLLASIPHEHLSEAEQPVLQLLASKCRDKDCQTRSLAFGVLAASPARALLAHLSLDQWRSIISSGVLLNQGQTAAKAEQSQVSHELMRHTADLLRIYMSQTGNGDASFVTQCHALQALNVSWQHLSSICAL